MIGRSIQTKLLLTFGLIFGIAAGNSVCSWITVGSIRTNVAREIQDSVTLLDQAHRITTGIANMRSAMRGVSLFTTQKMAPQVAKSTAAFEGTAAEMRQMVQTMEENASDSDRAAIHAISQALEQWVK